MSKDLPLWMKFLHEKLGNPSVLLNVRLFLAKLVINTEEVSYFVIVLNSALQFFVSTFKTTTKKEIKRKNMTLLFTE